MIEALVSFSLDEYQTLVSMIADKDIEIKRLRVDAERYQWLRARDLDTIHQGGIFAGMTPDNYVMNAEDLDNAIDKAMAANKGDSDA